MKKKFMFGMVASLLALSLFGCNKGDDSTTVALTAVETTSENATKTDDNPVTGGEGAVDAETMYESTLTDFCNLIANFKGDEVVNEGFMGTYEMTMQLGSKEAANTIGYTFTDLNDDNKPELLIGYIDDQSTNKGSTILACYAIEGANTKLVFEGWTRNNYTILDDCRITNQASGGAAYFGFGTYVVDSNNKLTCQDYYFSTDEASSDGTVAFYHSKVDDWNVANAEKLDITSDEFYGMNGSDADSIMKFSFTPFAEYAQAHNIEIKDEQAGDAGTDSQQSELDILAGGIGDEVRLTDPLLLETDNTEFVEVASDYAVKLAIVPNDSVKDFKVLGLTAKEDGSFDTKEVYSLEQLSYDKPLVISISFPGDVPQYGISFVDSNGSTRKYAICQSGENGAYFLSEF